ncbi:energy-coupling factor transporter transmembrane component T [Alkalihalobacillus macyae]|uniref:energy-coupling factor transporter transmembrane component T family protein n=1 Tax=Guptibacillus hwajinpoensis TaxID=208199 RepID=UPI00273B181E|nr:energy-coupling factor transporter transmembrane component T [Alkalihalobacillus macyae]MDP4553279.1 energy-coupling factor transporter transmembrane component T [Alkalihalobacillus macyae]
MMQNIIIGQYVPGQSFIHKLDPRAKLLTAFLFVIIVFLANNWLTYALLGGFTLIAVFVSRLPLRYIYNGLKPILLVIILTFLLHVFLTKEGPLLFDLGFLEVYEGGVKQGVFISLRLLFLIMITSLLTLTTTPIDITVGIETLLGPMKKIGLPVHEFALMMSIALRFIPTLLEETEKIMKAQSARGAQFSTGPIKERLKSIVPLLVPLFVSAFKRAEDLAMAMEARGYRGGEGRTSIRLLKWSGKDTMLFIILLILSIGLLLLRS